MAGNAKKPDGDAEVLAAIAAMSEPNRSMGERLHALIKKNAPDLVPRTWYGMPAYSKDKKVICYFRSSDKFKERYMTFGFNDGANLDDGVMWPIVFALTDMTPIEEARIEEIVRKAAG